WRGVQRGTLPTDPVHGWRSLRRLDRSSQKQHSVQRSDAERAPATEIDSQDAGVGEGEKCVERNLAALHRSARCERSPVSADRRCNRAKWICRLPKVRTES